MRKKLKLRTLRKLLTLCPTKGSSLYFFNLVAYTAPNQYPMYSFSEKGTKVVKGGRNQRWRREKKDRTMMNWEWGIFCYVQLIAFILLAFGGFSGLSSSKTSENQRFVWIEMALSFPVNLFPILVISKLANYTTTTTNHCREWMSLRQKTTRELEGYAVCPRCPRFLLVGKGLN